jgi:pimeloyl-ACP methyl ester carboxylesterase
MVTISARALMPPTIIPGMTSRRKRRLVLVAGVMAAGLWLAAPYVRAAAFILDIAGVDDMRRSLLPVQVYRVQTEDMSIATRHGAVPARLYRPELRGAPLAVVFPGVHGGGVDEARLVRLCGRLASTGVTVLCAPLPELRRFVVTRTSTDQIEDVTLWATGAPRLSANGRATLVGVSFAGGLVLVAAGRQSLDGRLDLVLSLGGYGDLPRTLRYLCTGELPDGTERTPHEYSLAVVALAGVQKLVPRAQADGLERGIRTYLEASLDRTPDRRDALRLVAAARAQAAALDEPARGVLTAVIDRNRRAIGRLMLPWIEELAADPALSPERSRAARSPVFLLHGLDDNVIPSSETPLVAEYLRRQRAAPVRALLTPLISHVGVVAAPSPMEAWTLVRFWREVFATIG